MSTADPAIEILAPGRARRAGGRAAGGGFRSLAVPAFLTWLPLAAVAVALCGVVYLSAQQSLRSGANDPQVQMAGDLAAQLGAGADPAQLLGTARIELSSSLSPFAMVFDAGGHPLAATARLDGQVPAPPPGVLRAAERRRNEVTWQPRPGVRSAVVVVPFRSGAQGGTVLVGRSLREVEQRDRLLLAVAAAGLAGSLALTGLACLTAAWLRRRLQVS